MILIEQLVRRIDYLYKIGLTFFEYWNEFNQNYKECVKI